MAVRSLATVACIVGALAALVLSYLGFGDLYLTGFPDGHLTDYDTAVESPKRILVWAELGSVPLFATLAFAPISTRVRAVGLYAVLVALMLVAGVQVVGIPWYFGSFLGLDNGIGG